MAEVPSAEIVTVGEALVDFVTSDARQLSEAVHFRRSVGGALANVAVAARRLGTSTALVSAVGDDPFGVYIKNLLEENGVDIRWVRTVSNRTTLAFVTGNRGGTPDFVFYRGADATLRAEHLPADLLGKASFVHLSSMALLGEPARSATLTAAQLAHRGGALVSVDPNLRPSSWPSLDQARTSIRPLIDAANIFKVNDEEARWLGGSPDLDDAMNALSAPGRLLIVTCGAEGCRWLWHGESGQVLSPTVEVADTTGAGDAFIGTLLAELCARGFTRRRFTEVSGANLKEIMRFSCAAGALASTESGAIASLPTRDEVEKLLRSD